MQGLLDYGSRILTCVGIFFSSLSDQTGLSFPQIISSYLLSFSFMVQSLYNLLYHEEQQQQQNLSGWSTFFFSYTMTHLSSWSQIFLRLSSYTRTQSNVCQVSLPSIWSDVLQYTGCFVHYWHTRHSSKPLYCFCGFFLMFSFILEPISTSFLLDRTSILLKRSCTVTYISPVSTIYLFPLSWCYSRGPWLRLILLSFKTYWPTPNPHDPSEPRRPRLSK